MTHRLNIFLVILLAVIGLPTWWLLYDESPYGVPPQPLEIAHLRQLADAIPGPHPTEVKVQLVGWNLDSGALYATGHGFKRRMLGVMGFVLPVPGKGPVVIDTGTAASLVETLQLDKFEPEGQRALDAQMRQASLIVPTGMRGDHLGGLAALTADPDRFSILARSRLNRKQLPSDPQSARLPWHGKIVIQPTIIGIRPQALAPGVVVIPAPSHTPGTQMIYVRLASGAEYLFTGEVSALAVNWKEQRPRSRLLTDWLEPEDRRATASWLATVNALKQAAPALHVIAAHDFDWLVDPDNSSGVTPLSAAAPAKPAGN